MCATAGDLTRLDARMTHIVTGWYFIRAGRRPPRPVPFRFTATSAPATGASAPLTSVSLSGRSGAAAIAQRHKAAAPVHGGRCGWLQGMMTKLNDLDADQRRLPAHGRVQASGATRRTPPGLSRRHCNHHSTPPNKLPGTGLSGPSPLEESLAEPSDPVSRVIEDPSGLESRYSAEAGRHSSKDRHLGISLAGLFFRLRQCISAHGTSSTW